MFSTNSTAEVTALTSELRKFCSRNESEVHSARDKSRDEGYRRKLIE